MLEHAAPLGQPWSVCNSDIECVPGIPSRNDLESRGQWHPFSLSQKNPKMHIWCKFDDPISKQLIVETSQISKNFETKWPWSWKSMTSTNFLSASSCLLEHIDVQVCVDIYMNNACIVEIIWKKFRHIHYIMLWDPNDFFNYKIPLDKLWNNSTGS